MPTDEHAPGGTMVGGVKTYVQVIFRWTSQGGIRQGGVVFKHIFDGPFTGESVPIISIRRARGIRGRA